MDRQLADASPPPPPSRPIDTQQDIQQSGQAVDQLITKLAGLLEQANRVQAEIIQARRAEHGATIADPPPPEPQQEPQPQREESQAASASAGGVAAASASAGGVAAASASAGGVAAASASPQDDPTRGWWTESQQEYHRSYADATQPAQCQPWGDNAQPAEQQESWMEWTDLEDTGKFQ